MIGTNIRSIRHLFNVSDTSLKTVLVKFKEDTWDICKVVKMPKDSAFGETLFLFNNHVRQTHWPYENIVGSKDFKKYKNINDITSNYGRVISVCNNEFNSIAQYFGEIILLPDSFDKDYEKFLKENSKMCGNLSSKFGFNSRDIRSKRLYLYTDGSKNFFQWAVTAHFQNGVSIATIKSILLWNESYKQLVKNLSKGTITAYTTKDSIVVLLDEMAELRKEKRINDSISSFNTAQKKMLKEHELSSDVKQALWRFSRLSETKQLNFIKKMSSVDDFNELSKQLKFVTSVHFSWNKESFMDFLTNVEGIQYEKIFENDNVVLVKTLDYETIKQLGKTTNWCISKNKQYWNNYIENYHGAATQYMIFDFSKAEDDKLSIIGFTTTRNKGITSAHNFVNEPLMGLDENEQVVLDSFISRFKENKNIFTILSDDGIDITLVVHYDMPSYKWEKNSLMDYLYECVNPENVDILMDKDNKMVLSITDEHIRYFLGDAYHDNIPSDYYNWQHILFIDFNKNKYDINKLQFAIIEEGYADEDYCNCVYNERSLNNGTNFDSKLIEFGLPYNTIRRTNNIEVRLRNAIASYNSPMIKDCMKECDSKMLKKVIKEQFGSDGLFDMITRTIRNYVSFDYLNLIYDNGLSLKEFLSPSYIGDIIKTFTHDITVISRASSSFTKLEAVSDNDIERFFNREIERREDAKYIGLFVAIKKILQIEHFDERDYNDVYRRFSNYIVSGNRQGDIYEQIFMFGLDKIDFSHKDDCTVYILKYIAYWGKENLKEFARQASSKNHDLNRLYESFEKEANKLHELTDKIQNNNQVYVDASRYRNVFANAFDDFENPF